MNLKRIERWLNRIVTVVLVLFAALVAAHAYVYGDLTAGAVSLVLLGCAAFLWFQPADSDRRVATLRKRYPWL